MFGTFATIAALALLIVVHESGHFLAARLQGIYVNRFSIGFGPILWKYQGKETEYALRAFPLGGFVGFPDDDPDSEIPPNHPNLMRNRPVLDRAIVISAGVIANLVFAYFVFVAQYSLVGIPEKYDFQPGVIVPEVTSQEAPAAKAGIKSGDVILAVDGQALESSDAAIQTLMTVIRAKPNQPIDFKVKRGEQQLNIPITPQVGEDGWPRLASSWLPTAASVSIAVLTACLRCWGWLQRSSRTCL